MARPAALTLEALPAVAPDLGQALLGWDRWLATERRAADHTLDAYRRDVVAFLVLVLILILRPTGIFKQKETKRA